MTHYKLQFQSQKKHRKPKDELIPEPSKTEAPGHSCCTQTLQEGLAIESAVDGPHLLFIFFLGILELGGLGELFLGIQELGEAFLGLLELGGH